MFMCTYTRFDLEGTFLGSENWKFLVVFGFQVANSGAWIPDGAQFVLVVPYTDCAEISDAHRAGSSDFEGIGWGSYQYRPGVMYLHW